MTGTTDFMADILPLLRRILLLAITVYIIISGVLFFLQEQIIFHQPGITEERLLHIRARFPEAEEVTIDTPDNISLHGWLVRNDSKGPSPLLIYFGGNAEEVSWMIEEKDNFSGWTILLVNYRGYGLSEGYPEEDALMKDALLLYDTFADRKDVRRDAIAVMGRSLGSAVATYLSGTRSPAATVLVSSFGSIEDVARQNFPFIPVGLLLKHKFNVKPFAEKAGNPMLTLVASDDRIIAPFHSNNLYEAWQGRKEMVVIQNTGHNDISHSHLYWEVISNFLDGRAWKDYRIVGHPDQ
jgi:uncharacterized protein